MTYYEMVKKLVGEINPVGETYEDTRRLNNLENMIALVDHLMSDIDKVAMNKGRPEYSVNKAGTVASEYLDSLGIKC